MAKRRRRRLIRPRLAIGLLVMAVLAVGYGYWAPFPYRPIVLAKARSEGLNPYLVAAVIRVESGFRPTVISRRGAIGLMQLLPSTALWISGKMHHTGTPNLNDPATNIELGTWYLNYLKTRFHGNWTLTLAAYNGGPETVSGWLKRGVLSSQENGYRRIPYPETKNFVRRVTRYESAYRLMYFWLQFGKHSSRGGGLIGKINVRGDENEAW